MIYDKDLLLESVSAIDVAEALGLPMKFIGNRYYIPCPTHLSELGKEDTNLGNCIYKMAPGKTKDYYVCWLIPMLRFYTSLQNR